MDLRTGHLRSRSLGAGEVTLLEGEKEGGGEEVFEIDNESCFPCKMIRISLHKAATFLRIKSSHTRRYIYIFFPKMEPSKSIL